MIQRPIPSTGETIPVIGLGTWQTFDVPPESADQTLGGLLSTFAAEGGLLVDSSPMYGKAEEAVGTIRRERNLGSLFVATKVWTRGERPGERQMSESLRRLGLETIDLLQIHNLVDWKTHLRTLRRWKDEGRVRYLGITHYQLSAFDDLERVMRAEKVDFVQLPYSPATPDAEDHLLPLARDLGIATIINRPFEEGSTLRALSRKPFPSWLEEAGCRSWGEAILRYIVAHPAVTCVIPATGDEGHLRSNLAAGNEPLMDAETRERLRAAMV